MGWLQETVEKALGRDASDETLFTQQRTLTKKLWEEEKNREQAVKKKARESRQVMKASGVEFLLRDVSRKIWRGGKLSFHIVNVSKTVSGENRLVDSYPEIRLEHRYPSEDFGGSEMGTLTELVSLAVRNIDGNQSFVLGSTRHSDAFVGTLRQTYSSANISVNDPGALDKVKDFLREDCEMRIREHRLPRDFKTFTLGIKLARMIEGKNI